MNLQEINFEQAKLLKQAGFVEHTTKFYDKNGVLTGSLPVNHNLHKDRFSCVTVALAIQWLREQKDILIIPNYNRWNNKFFYDMYYNKLSDEPFGYQDHTQTHPIFSTIEKASYSALSECFGILSKRT